MADNFEQSLKTLRSTKLSYFASLLVLRSSLFQNSVDVKRLKCLRNNQQMHYIYIRI
jgi:hypothetical protein